MSSVKGILAKLCILLLFCDRMSCLIIPEELPTILSLIYSNIPPIKKGTDSRVGLGFRLGEHADFQVLFELGPQSETNPIGNADSKRRRDAMLNAAMKGDLGPLAQAIAKYQMKRKLQGQLEKLKKTEEKERISAENNNSKKTAASEWLTKWSKDMTQSSENQASLEVISSEKSLLASPSKTIMRIGRPPNSNERKGTINDLMKLYKQQDEQEKTPS